jgi:hypothetical protein
LRTIDGLTIKNKSQPDKGLQSNNFRLKSPKKALASYLKVFFVLVGIIFLNGIIYLNIGCASDAFNSIKMIFDSKHLVLLQNNAELRPTGGFIGSFAEIDTKFAKIINQNINTNIYKLDDKYDYVLQITPPPEIKKIVSDGYWAMRDANWSPDYPTSAEKVAWFYNQEGGSKIDNVLAVNASLVRDILKIIGPIYLPQNNIIIDSDNFFDQLHKNIEIDYYQSDQNKLINEPKTILKELSPQIIERVKDYDNRAEIVKFMLNQIKTKNIMFYSKSSILENIFKTINVAGQIKDASGDYLSINNSNLGGMKSSLNIIQNIKLNVVKTGSSQQNDLTVIRTHTGNGTWPDFNNNNFSRIILPNNINIQSITLDGVNIINKSVIYNEFNKTIISFWFSVDIGKSKTLNIKYNLNNLLDGYSLYYQSQPGVENNDLNLIVNNFQLFNDSINVDKQIE